MPVGMARHIVRARERAKKLYEDTFDKEFTEEKMKAMERTIIAQMKAGEVAKQNDVTKLIDTFVNNPDTIDTFLKGKTSVTKLYLDSNAKVAHHARNAKQLSNMLESHIKQTIELGGTVLLEGDREAKRGFERVKAQVENILSKI